MCRFFHEISNIAGKSLLRDLMLIDVNTASDHVEENHTVIVGTEIHGVDEQVVVLVL